MARDKTVKQLADDITKQAAAVEEATARARAAADCETNTRNTLASVKARLTVLRDAMIAKLEGL